MAKRKILVIDDEKLIQWSLEQELSRDGYEVFSASTGEAGLQLFDRESPDLTIVDIRLPGADGIEILEKIKAQDKEHPIIMITAFGDVGTAVRAMKLGAFDYLTKPFDLEEVKLVVGKALESRMLRQEVSELRKKERQTNQIVGASPEIKKVLEAVQKGISENSKDQAPITK